jgi:uncharacterized phiE125 gp8 family phage protein
MLNLVQTVAPASEPITTAEAKAFLRVDSSDEDTLIDTLIATARQIVEDFTGRAIITQTWKLTLDKWPLDCRGWLAWLEVNTSTERAILLPRSPLASVTSVKYYPDDLGAQATLSASTYRVITGTLPGAVFLKSSEDWPVLDIRPDAVEIIFVAGAADATTTPKQLTHAILLLVAHLYENRAPVNVGNIVNEIPFTVRALLESQRVGGWIA